MKRRRRGVSIVGSAAFLPTLPAENLEEWLLTRAQHQQHASSSVSAGSNSSPTPLVPASGKSFQSSSADSSVVAEGRFQGSKRKDIPKVRKSSDLPFRHEAILVSDPRALGEAMSDLRNDYYAASSRKPRDALLAIWSKFHKHWYGQEANPIPVTEESLERVACLFKLGGYKSFKNYLSRIKEVHDAAGYVWDNSLHYTARRCTRSVLRGLGGPTRSEQFDAEKVIEYLQGNDLDLGLEGPTSPLAATVVATFFLLREIELANIDVGDVSFTHGDQPSVTLYLPVSKVDWQAKGCRRTWACICRQKRPCPVHLLLEYDKIRRQMDPSSGPWIPNGYGDRCSKVAIETMIRTAVEGVGGLSKSADGRWVISGHCFRITGARTLASWGLDPISIQLLGRWGSSAVLSYLAETPLLTFTDRLNSSQTKKLIDASAVSVDNMELVECVKQLKLERDAQRKECREVSDRIENLSTAVDGIVQVIQDRHIKETWWIHNDVSKIMHMALIDLSMSPMTWKTFCGWKFSSQPLTTTHRESPTLPVGSRHCPKCNPSQNSSSSSSESSS